MIKQVLTIRGTGFTPYPDHPYYLSDLWRFNLTTHVWMHLELNPDDDLDTRPLHERVPAARLDHSLVVTDDVFVLFGGYVTNYYYDDTWQ
jgi:hypothetical protein